MSAEAAFIIGDAEALQAEVLAFGGVLRSLRLRGRELVLGLPRLEDYQRDRAYLGALVGRVANRISGAAFEIDGRRYQLTANEAPNQLHGGFLGFSKRSWTVVRRDRDALSLEYRSVAGEEGYPGNLQVQARFRVEATTLVLEFTAISDATTPLSLTFHPYFNLGGDGRQPLADHRLRIPASRYLPIDAALLPTGEFAPVEGTPFDFRSRQSLAALGAGAQHPQLRLAGGFDHCWVLDGAADCAAELQCASSGITLQLRADAPGLQFYSGQHLPGQHPALRRGLCLEPQGLPNAVNVPAFPSVLVRPGQPYLRRFEYGFSVRS